MWSGGTYTKGNNATGGWTGDASLGIGIEAGRHDTQDNDFATGINTCLTKDGQNAATADLPMGGFKHTNVAVATARNNYAAVSQVQDGDFIWLGTTGGTATAQTATASPAITAYKAGQKFRMKIGSGLGSTGATPNSHTLNINGIGTKDIASNSSSNSSPTLGTWVAGAIMEVVYDGTYFQIVNDPGDWLTWTPTLTPSNGTASSVLTNARFRKSKNMVFITLDVSWTQNTASALYVTLTMPINIDGTNQTIPAMVTPSANSYVGLSFAGSATVFRFYTYDGATQFLTGAGKGVWANAMYRGV